MSERIGTTALALLGSLLVSGVAQAASAPIPMGDEDEWVISADVVYTGDGTAIEGGLVVVAGGKITAVGTSGGSPDFEVAAVTPGMVDLGVRIDTGAYSVEQTTEAALPYRVADTIDPFSFQWKREREHGVTTALATPFDMNVIGGLCTVLKTGGPLDVGARELRPDAALRACIGTQPSSGNSTPTAFAETSIFTRRPTTRMGVEWVFRKTYYDAINAERFELEVDAGQAEQNALVLQTLKAGLPVIARAQATQDVRTAIYLKEEFGIQRMILDDAVEAWKEPELVRRSGVGIVLPPYPVGGRVRDRFANDTYFFALEAAAELHELGVPIALSGHGSSDPESRLHRQAGYAMRGGLSFDAALAAVTIEPARMIGVDDRVGSIAVGKDADLVLWNGKPFEATSGIIGVLIDGRLVLDPRPAEDEE